MKYLGFPYLLSLQSVFRVVRTRLPSPLPKTASLEFQKTVFAFIFLSFWFVGSGLSLALVGFRLHCLWRPVNPFFCLFSFFFPDRRRGAFHRLVGHCLAINDFHRCTCDISSYNSRVKIFSLFFRLIFDNYKRGVHRFSERKD